MAEQRNSRDMESRDTELRAQDWRPPNALPTPEPKDGYVFRWVRTSTINEADKTNVSKRFREGWRPVPAKECPELVEHIDPFSQGKETIEIGGLILCKMPIEIAKQRDAYYLRSSLGQIDAVDHSIFKTEDRRMPVLPAERRTHTSNRPDN